MIPTPPHSNISQPPPCIPSFAHFDYYFISLVICLHDQDLQKAYPLIIKPWNEIYVDATNKLIRKINKKCFDL